MPSHPAIVPGRVAVITGGASGIGLACAKRLAAMGLKIVIADNDAEQLHAAMEQLQSVPEIEVAIGKHLDVSQMSDVEKLRDTAFRLGEVAIVMNNAAIGPGPAKPWEDLERWRQVIGANMWGVVHGVHAFTPALIAQGTPAAIVNTGSKQGITNPPGGTSYNVSKSAVKTLTEQLSLALSQEAPQITAHLLVPGFTFTGIGGRRPDAEKPPGAWSADQVAGFLLESLGRGDFYILCEDNMVTRPVDERRMQWAIDDLIKNRPALSRWRPEFKDACEAFMQG